MAFLNLEVPRSNGKILEEVLLVIFSVRLLTFDFELLELNINSTTLTKSKTKIIAKKVVIDRIY